MAININWNIEKNPFPLKYKIKPVPSLFLLFPAVIPSAVVVVVVDPAVSQIQFVGDGR